MFKKDTLVGTLDEEDLASWRDIRAADSFFPDIHVDSVELYERFLEVYKSAEKREYQFTQYLITRYEIDESKDYWISNHTGNIYYRND